MPIHNIERLKINYRDEDTDLGTIKEIFINKEYEKYFKIEKNEHWLDLGANIGLFSLYCLLKGAVSTAYEPNEENFKLLNENLKLNNCLINRFKFAIIGNDDKIRKLYLRKKGKVFRKTNSGGNSLSIDTKGIPEFEEVNCININRVISNEIDAIKLDVEGSEYEIIKNIKDFKNIKKLCMEYHFNHLKDMKKYWEVIDILLANFNYGKYPKYNSNLKVHNFYPNLEKVYFWK